MPVDKILFSAYHPFEGPVTKEKIQTLAHAGIDNAILSAPRPDLIEALDLLDEYGCKAIVCDRRAQKTVQKLIAGNAGFFDPEKAEYIEQYVKHPAFWASEFVDEPGLVYFTEIGQAVRDYAEHFPDKHYYVNLSPSHVSNIQYTAGPNIFDIGDVDVSKNTFQHYLDEFIRLVPVDYICLDIYPFKLETMWDSYLDEMEVIARTCKRAGREFWLCVQSAAWYPEVHMPDEDEYRWQMYTALAFGVVHYMLYGFTGKHWDGVTPLSESFGLRGAPVTEDGARGELYFEQRRIAREFHAISDVFLQYAYAGVFTVNCTDDTPFLKINNTLPAYGPILDVLSDQPFLVGCFEKKDGAPGHALVIAATAGFRGSPQGSELRLKLNGRVTAYYDGAPLPLSPDSDGYYTFTLRHCGGVFVTIE